MPASELIALNADVVGYSCLMADDFQATTAVMDEYRDLVERTVAANEGTLVNFVGDSFMAVFEKATAAMKAAIAISADVEERNDNRPSSRRMQFRMGLDMGPVSQSGTQWFGDALNIAARIQAIAPPGGVSVSGKVYQALDEPELRFRSRGRQHLKNIPEEVDVYEYSGLPTGGDSPRSRMTLADPVVALLPVHDESLSKGVEGIGKVIRDELKHRLSAIHNLTLVDADGTENATAQGSSNYALETGIHQLGSSLRVYSRLIDISTWNIVSSLRWTAKIEEAFDLVDEVAGAVARTIEVELVVGEPARLYAELGDPGAIQKVYTGWFYLTGNSRESWVKAMELFADVSLTHPDQPFGTTLHAFALWAGAVEGFTDDRAASLEETLLLADEAIRRGDPTGMGQMVKAAVYMSQGRADESRTMLEQLEIARPTCDTTFALEGSVRRYLGEWDKSVDLMKTAQRLTPVTKPWYPTVEACSYYMAGNLEQASQLAEAVVEYQPDNLEALLVLAATQLELGLERRAKATAELIRERFPGVDVDAWIDENPYQQPEAVERWKEDLRAAGAIS